MTSKEIFERAQQEGYAVGAFNAANLVDVVRNLSAEFGVPMLINLDHSPSVEAAEAGIAAGYDLIHINASKLPYEENIAATKKIADEAHAKGLLCEAELTPIGGTSAVHEEKAEEAVAQEKLTDPDQAEG